MTCLTHLTFYMTCLTQLNGFRSCLCQEHIKIILTCQEHTNYQLSFTDILCFFYFQKFVLKEGCKFKIRIEFYVQRDIITGLKYVQKTYMKGIPG